MSCGNTFNQTSIEIAEAQYKLRQQSPSVALRAAWHKEFLESGAQYKMSFYTFQKHKTKEWYQQRELRNWTFGCGTHKGKKIKDVIKHNIEYIEFVLEKQPKGKVAKQIINFIERNPDVLQTIKLK
jgi:hypothetical protein